MKIRIRGNSVRFRLTKSEVDKFGKDGYVEERTDFGDASLVYALQKSDGNGLNANFDGTKITMLVPEDIQKKWVDTQVVGFDNMIDLGNGKELYLLLEKDFKCLDETIEDQSDNYEHPLAAQLGK